MYFATVCSLSSLCYLGHSSFSFLVARVGKLKIMLTIWRENETAIEIFFQQVFVGSLLSLWEEYDGSEVAFSL